MPLLIGMIPLDEMMSLFVVGSAHLPVAVQIQFTNAICLVFFVSALLSVPAIIVSALRGTGITGTAGRTIPRKGIQGRRFSPAPGPASWCPVSAIASRTPGL